MENWLNSWKTAILWPRCTQLPHSRPSLGSLGGNPEAPPDWRRPVGRPKHTWLRAVELDLRPLNIGLSSAWRKTAIRDDW